MSGLSVRKPKNQIEEDSTTLQLGEDFQDSECLLISEVKILLEAQKNAKLKENKPISAVHDKTLKYASQFSRFNNQDSLREVRKVLNASNLSSFELAQLGNLCCNEPNEAKALIPSLGGRIDDDQLDLILKQIDTIKNFQTQ